MRKWRVAVLAAIVALGLMPTQQAWAQDPIHKLGRGVTNVLTGWIELFKHIDRGKQEDNPFSGVAGGVMKGLGLTILRAGTGAYEAVTFPFAWPKHYASPYAEMELNDYAWE